MYGLTLPATEEGTEDPQKGLQPSAGARRRGTEHPKLLVLYNRLFICKVIYLQVIIVYHIDREYSTYNYSTVIYNSAVGNLEHNFNGIGNLNHEQ